MKDFEKIDKEEEYWLSLTDLEGYNLNSIPELLSIVVDEGIKEVNDFPVTQIDRVGNELKLSVSKMLRPEEFWNQKYTPLKFAEAVVKGIKIVSSNKLKILDVDFSDEGSEDGICIWWTLMLPVNSSISEIEKSVLKSVDIAFNQGLNFLDGLSSVLILGKDSDESLERLKFIAEIVESLGYNPVIIKEKNDLLGETVIQKVLRYGLQSKFVIVENTESSGHLYEIPHIVKMAEKITIVLQENGKGATWMFEEMYFNLKTVKKYLYDNNDENLKESLMKSIEWANKTFTQLCEYQTKELPWMQK